MIPDATIIILFTFRFVQNTKIVKNNGWKIIPAFFGLFRVIASLLLALLSWIYRKKLALDEENNNLYNAFIFSGCLSTLVAFLVDLKTDWGMLNG